MPFEFKLFENDFEDDEYIGTFVQLRFEYNGYYALKWFYPLKTNNGISVSSNREIYNSNVLEKFIKDIKNNIDCKYYRDDEVIFEYNNGRFIIDTGTMMTGCNLPIDNLLLEIYDKNEDVIQILTDLHTWLKSL